MASEIIKAEKVLKIGQRLEFYLEGSEEGYKSRLEDIQKDCLIVAMPFDKKRVPIIPVRGDSIYGLASGDQCRYRFLTTFQGVALDGQVPTWIIVKPETVERHQNREFVRVRVSLHLRIRLIDEEGRIEKPFETDSIDLSGNGIGFVLDRPVKEDSQATIEISEIPNVGTLDILCRIVRVARVERDDGTSVWRVGAAFQNVPRPVTNKIVHYIFTVQRQSIARGISIVD